MAYDFSGYATRAGIVCTDGRVIKPGAFKHQDGKKVPLVWQHLADTPTNVLGHVYLQSRDDGMYCNASFNKSATAVHARELLEHDDIESLSIRAVRLKQVGSEVHHGDIHEVSLVLAGANPGAYIETVNRDFEHYDDDEEGEAIIFTGLSIEHSDSKEDMPPTENLEHEDGGETLADVFNTLDDKQKDVVYAMLAAVAGEDITHSDDDDDEDEDEDDSEDDESDDDEDEDPNQLEHSAISEGTTVTRNVFDGTTTTDGGTTLTHSQISNIVQTADKIGSLRDAVLQHADEYGISNIELLFPDAKELNNTPEFISRRMEWVNKVVPATHKTPFSRVKTTQADITAEEARAKGYVKGNRKTDEVFSLLHRETNSTTVYKKQKLDRDDIIDITSFDVVAWMKAEMRVMLEEELARAILVGDGRAVDDPDKIKDPGDAPEGSGIRSIISDDELYAHRLVVPAGASTEDVMEQIVRARKHYKGSGNPTFFTNIDFITDMLFVKDEMGRRIYKSQSELASELNVKELVDVELLEGFEREGKALVGIMVNLKDYNIGTNRGGEINFFDNFDIDFNQYKYLYETRLSGALTRVKSAVVVELDGPAGAGE